MLCEVIKYHRSVHREYVLITATTLFCKLTVNQSNSENYFSSRLIISQDTSGAAIANGYKPAAMTNGVFSVAGSVGSVQ